MGITTEPADEHIAEILLAFSIGGLVDEDDHRPGADRFVIGVEPTITVGSPKRSRPSLVYAPLYDRTALGPSDTSGRPPN
ncbi:MAG: hypothetical protein ACRDZM_01640 [Acidimicrobiia bacterium]